MIKLKHELYIGSGCSIVISSTYVHVEASYECSHISFNYTLNLHRKLNHGKVTQQKVLENENFRTSYFLP